MCEEGLDAVLLGTGMNLEYFSGFPSPHKSVARPFFLLIPSRRDPVFFTYCLHPHLAGQGKASVIGAGISEL